MERKRSMSALDERGRRNLHAQAVSRMTGKTKNGRAVNDGESADSIRGPVIDPGVGVPDQLAPPPQRLGDVARVVIERFDAVGEVALVQQRAELHVESSHCRAVDAVGP